MPHSSLKDHVTTSQKDIPYLNIKHPSDDLPDGYSKLKYKRNSYDFHNFTCTIYTIWRTNVSV